MLTKSTGRVNVAATAQAVWINVLVFVSVNLYFTGAHVAAQNRADTSGCARGIIDRADSDRCIFASTLPRLGMLYPISEDLFVSPFGDVGIGITDPTARLHLNGNMRLEYGMSIEGNTANSIGYLNIAKMDGDNVLYIGAGNTNRIDFKTGGTGVVFTNPSSDAVRIRMGATPQNFGAAFVELENTNNGHRNVLLDYIVDSQTGEEFFDNGFVGVLDPLDEDNIKAAIFVDESGDGVVFGDVKNFCIPNPIEPGTDIWYACVEGPEAAMYVRGTAQLVAGTATIQLPDHFTVLAAVDGITVQLTPLSAESQGLAVVNKSRTGFEVRELHKGTGDYEFDWEVKAVRSAHENYRVIRPARKTTAASIVSSE